MTIRDMRERIANRERAIAIVRELLHQHHSLVYIAKALNLRNVPALSGEPGRRWHHSSVSHLIKAEGLGNVHAA